MRLFVVVIFFALCPMEALATAQFPDVLIYNEKKLSLFSNPLKSYFGEQTPKPKDVFTFSCTANWRGHVATWKIDHGDLYLIKLVDGSCDSDASTIPVGKVFPGRSLPIKATWFSGILRIPRGETLQYVHMGYGSTYERDLLLFIKAGKLMRKVIVFNATPKKHLLKKKIIKTPNSSWDISLIKLPGAQGAVYDTLQESERLIYSLGAAYPATGVIGRIEARLQAQGWVPVFERNADDHTADWQPAEWQKFNDFSPGKPFSDIPKGKPVVVNLWYAAWVNARGDRIMLSLTYAYQRDSEPNLSHVRVSMVYSPQSVAAEPLLGGGNVERP